MPIRGRLTKRKTLNPIAITEKALNSSDEYRNRRSSINSILSVNPRSRVLPTRYAAKTTSEKISVDKNPFLTKW